MNPGHSAGKDGYWMSYQFRMQALLGLLVFEKVYRAIVPEGYVLVDDPMDVAMEFFYVDQLDWSQNHAELAKNAHDAKKMNCSPGGAQPHIKYTIHHPEPGLLLYLDGSNVNRVVRSARRSSLSMEQSQGSKQ